MEKMRKINVVCIRDLKWLCVSKRFYCYLLANRNIFLHVLKALISNSCLMYCALFALKVSGGRKQIKINR